MTDHQKIMMRQRRRLACVRANGMGDSLQKRREAMLSTELLLIELWRIDPPSLRSLAPPHVSHDSLISTDKQP